MAELARRNFMDFVKITKPDYDANWHHDLLAEYIQAFVNKEIKKLMVFMPPQHGKSELTSRRLPAYLLGKNPRLKIAGCSYSADLSIQFNREVQRVLTEPMYRLIFPDTRINERNVVSDGTNSYLRNSGIFETIPHRGFYKSVGVGSSLTGTPVDIAIIDDPVKDAVEGQSPNDQLRKWEWYTDVLLTRLHNDSQQILTMTRWHKKDLAGLILDKMPEGWEVLRLEAIKKDVVHPKDPRKFGEALWEKRHSKKRILQIAKSSPRTFDALYQGDPKPNKSLVYATGFLYSKNVTELHYDPEKPIHYTVDFNTSPYMSGLVIQMEFIQDDYWNGYEEYWEVNIIDQFALKSPINDAKSLGAQLEQKYPDVENGFFLYGDASGNSNTGISTNDKRKTATLFSDLMSGLSSLARHNCIKRVPKANPSYRSIGKGMVGRRVFLNELLQGTKPVRLRIDPKCFEVITDLEECSQDANGKLAKPKNKFGVEERGHMLQALEYYICHPKSIGYLAKIKR